MAGKLSFSIAINLLTENFKKGTNQVKSAFKSMQMQLLTFTAALGAAGIIHLFSVLVKGTAEIILVS